MIDHATASGYEHSATTALERAREREDLNAFISLFDETEIAQMPGADGVLAGTSVAIKDNIDVAGLRCTAGTPALADWRPPKDAVVVERLRRAGAAVIGKTNLHELAAGITSNNPTWGAVRNPHDPHLIAGGSSGGSAAAVSAEIVELALGTDTAGSCRIPAALCGCVGFRPTLGRYPLAGVLRLSSTRDTVGVFGRDIASVRLADSVLSNEAPTDRKLSRDLSGARLGVPRPYFYDGLDEGLARAVEEALGLLDGAGAVLVETEVADLESIVAPISLPMIFYESVRELSTYLNRHRAPARAWEVVEQVGGLAERGYLSHELWVEPVTDEAYRAIIGESRPALQAAYRACLEGGHLDALVLPTTPLPARPVGCDETVELNGVEVPTMPTYLRNTDPSAIAGLPSISVPAGQTSEGLPVGISFEGLPGTDAALLELASAFEQARA